MKFVGQIGVIGALLTVFSGCIGQGKSVEFAQQEPELPLVFQEIGKFKRQSGFNDHSRSPGFPILDPAGDLAQEAPLYQDFRVENPNRETVRFRIHPLSSPRFRMLTEFFFHEFDLNRTSGFATQAQYGEVSLEPHFQLRVTTSETETTREKTEVIPLVSQGSSLELSIPGGASAVLEMVFRLSPGTPVKQFWNCIGRFYGRNWLLSIRGWKGRLNLNRDVCLSEARCLSRGENLKISQKNVAYLGTGRDLEERLWREEQAAFIFGTNVLFHQKPYVGHNPPSNGECQLAWPDVTDLSGL